MYFYQSIPRYTQKPYTCEDIKSVWQKIPAVYLGYLAIQLGDNSILSFQDQFETKFEGQIFISRKLDHLINTIVTIFENNYALIRKIGRHKEIVDKLNDFENWWDVVKTHNLGVNSNNTVTDNSTDNIALNLTSDANSQKDQLTLKKIMFPVARKDGKSGKTLLFSDEEQVILANAMTQARTRDNNAANTDNTGINIGDSDTKSSNAAADYRSYLMMPVPNLREKLLAKFTYLFYA